MASLCIFEDDQISNLLPLTYLRPAYDLRCGILTLREKLQHSYGRPTTLLHCRSYLADVVRERNPGVSVNEFPLNSCLFLNGRIIAGENLSEEIPLKGEDTLYYSGETLVAARVGKEKLSSVILKDSFGVKDKKDFKRESVEVELACYPWDLVSANGSEIAMDFNRLVERETLRGTIYLGAHVLDKESVFVDEDAVVKPGAVLDAENGPIYIGRNVKIYSNAVIEGPAFIGENSLIKIGAKIYGGTSIGPWCKVGGEVEGSIIHSYSNKQHDGFLGHSYLGMWVNLGADTNNSDLKNNYGTVKVMIDGKSVDTGTMFVGLTMGDHSKSGINTMFNTGTVVGVSSNIFGGGFPPKSIPSFAWGGADGFKPYDLEKSIAVARTVMGRRKVQLSLAEEKLLRGVYAATLKTKRPLKRK